MRTRSHSSAVMVLCGCLCLASNAGGDEPAPGATAALAKELRELPGKLLSFNKEDADQLRRMLADDMRERRRQVNAADVEAWRNVKSREEWEQWRDGRIAALRNALGDFPEPPADLKPRVTRTIEGDGFRIENILFESRPGLVVTANLYSPAKPRVAMPGMLICHSHHNPKTQGELQDMGMNWARMGCVVLVMDQLGHGERRQHPFRTAADYDKSFQVGRQDYYFRYNTGIQLHLVGESLIGWMAWDLMRGVDLLLGWKGTGKASGIQRPSVDPNRIILLGAVAGGGDPAAVTAALDSRIAAVVPFNFGGPQPETTYPLPADAELSFNYVGGGSWESTRNISFSARDGFLPWVIVASVAPRRLIYAHEFSWDRPNDPVWKRLEHVFGRFYGVPGHLASVHGYGKVSLGSDQASHCNNIGAVHRTQIDPAFKEWFDIDAPAEEYRGRLEPQELMCIDGVAAAGDRRLTPLCEVADDLAGERLQKFRDRLAKQSPEQRRESLRTRWSELLADVTLDRPYAGEGYATDLPGGVSVVKFVFAADGETKVTRLLLSTGLTEGLKTSPAVIGISQQGISAFLAHRSHEIAKLVQAGIAVWLVDLRGCGETQPGSYRGRQSDATGISSSELMLGQTLVGSKLKDLRAMLAPPRQEIETTADQEVFEFKPIALWGESFAPWNAADRDVAVPLRIDDEPGVSEPLGQLLALLGALFEDQVVAVAADGGLVGYRSVLQSQFVYIPHDVVVPGALTAGDLSDLAAALAPRPLRISGLVDGTNKLVSPEQAEAEWRSVRAAYEAAGAGDKFKLVQQPDAEEESVADWLIRQLRP